MLGVQISVTFGLANEVEEEVSERHGDSEIVLNLLTFFHPAFFYILGILLKIEKARLYCIVKENKEETSGVANSIIVHIFVFVDYENNCKLISKYINSAEHECMNTSPPPPPISNIEFATRLRKQFQNKDYLRDPIGTVFPNSKCTSLVSCNVMT